MTESIHQTIPALFLDAGFWFLIAFIIFVAVLGRRIWQMIGGALDQHAQGIQDEIETAQKRQQLTSEALAEAKREYTKAESMAEAIVERAESEIERARADIEQNLELFVLARKKVAEERLKNTELQAEKSVRNQCVHIGIEAAAEILRKCITPEEHAKFVDQAIARIDQEQELRI